MAEEKDKDDHVPRWDVIEKLHDKIDEDINAAYDKDKLSFIEVDIALLMLKEKINQQKMEMYNMYFKAKEEEQGETKKAPDNLYR